MKNIIASSPFQEQKTSTSYRREKFMCISDSGLQAKSNKGATGEDIFWTSKLNAQLPVKLSLHGFGSVEPETIPTKFTKLVEAKGNKEALRQPKIQKSSKSDIHLDRKWKVWTFNDYARDVKLFAAALIKMNIPPRSTVNILGQNSPQWFISLMGTIHADCITAGVYTTNSPDTCLYVASDTAAKLIVVENEIQLVKYLKNSDKLKQVEAFIVYAPFIEEKEELLKSLQSTYKSLPKIYLFSQFLKLGKGIPIESRVHSQRPGQCCNIVYTSGTAGDSKGAMLSHDNMLWPISSLVATFAEQLEFTDNERLVSYLPLSHITAQSFDILGQLFHAATVSFPPSLASTLLLQNYQKSSKAAPPSTKNYKKRNIEAAVHLADLPRVLRECKPTLFLGVPHVWERSAHLVRDALSRRSKIIRVIASWGRNVTKKAVLRRLKYFSSKEQVDKPKNPFGTLAAKQFVIRGIQRAMGFDHTKLFISGAAPLKNDTLKFFQTLDMPILNVFGLSQTSGAASFNSPFWQKLGSAGVPVPGSELRVFNADSDGVGQLCFRGRGVFMGYLGDGQATASCIDGGGYFHTGDQGSVDKDGFITITGRLKDILVTAGGENVAPRSIEDRIKEKCPIVSHAIVVGDGKKYLTALLTLRVENEDPQAPRVSLIGEAAHHLHPEVVERLRADDVDSVALTIHEARNCQKVQGFIQKCFKKVNEAAPSRAQEVRRWIILPKQFSVQGGEITPTGKLKRRFIERKYREYVNQLYLVPHL